VRYRQVELCGTPADPDQRVTLPVMVVHAVELAPPAGEKPVEWFVLTTLAVNSANQAVELLAWYALRWRIEDWHRVLKSGCKIDELGHRSAERLERAIAIRMVIAWRVMLMTLLGREVPELPAELLFTDIELRVLGDYLNRKRDPPPGHQLMWQGYSTLATMSFAYALRDEIG